MHHKHRGTTRRRWTLPQIESFFKKNLAALLWKNVDSWALLRTHLLEFPELALVEIAQVMRKKELTGHLTSAECDEVLDAILELPLDVVGHHDLLRDAIAFSRSTHLTAYDALTASLVGTAWAVVGLGALVAWRIAVQAVRPLD